MHLERRGGLDIKAVPVCNGTQPNRGQLQMSITEDFLAVRTAGLENGLPWERREAPLTQDAGNQTKPDSGYWAQGRKPAVTADELDNMQDLFSLQLL